MVDRLGKIGTIIDWLGPNAEKLMLDFAEKVLLQEHQKRKRTGGIDPKTPKWSERTTGREVTPADFIKANYGITLEDGSWERNGLVMSDVREHDHALYIKYKLQIMNDPLENLNIPKKRRAKIADPVKISEQQREARPDYYYRINDRQP